MNQNTRVAVHCYEGDRQQVLDTLPVHLSHGCPIVILSPEDSRVEIEHPGVECRFGGKRCSIGQLSLDRQREHMKMLLSFPENFFLMNDADSVCLSAMFPDYLYNEPDVLWSNIVYDPIPSQQVGYGPRYYPNQDMPRLAFQPPYFASRRTLEAMLAVAEGVTANPIMGYIDHYMVQLAVRAKLIWKSFPDGLSAPISMEPGAVEHAQVAVRHKGTIFIHSVKSPVFLNPLVQAHQAFLADYRPAGDHRPAVKTNTTADVRIVGHELARSHVISRDPDHVYRVAKPRPAPPVRPRPLHPRDSIGRMIQRQRGIKA